MLNHGVFLTSLLCRIVSSLNQSYLPLFMINKVNVTFKTVSRLVLCIQANYMVKSRCSLNISII